MKHTFLALTLMAGTAFAQPVAPPPASAAAMDARFQAWLGCWRLDDDISGTGARMCITPEQSGVRLQTIIGNQKGIDEVVIADGVQRPIVDADCSGTERAEWSQDNSRVFRTTGVTCGKEAPRTIKSVAFMAPGPAWVIVQHVTGTSATTAVRVQRYRRSANQQLADGTRAAQPDAQLAARTTPEQTNWSIEDVVEASNKLPLEALQASLTEVSQKFPMNKKSLRTLAEGNVAPEVIDLMVALTYPEKFVVHRPSGGGGTAGLMMDGDLYGAFMTPMLMGGFADCYSPFGYGYRSYYSYCGAAMYGAGLWGYNYYNRYGYYNPYYNGWVNVAPPVIGGLPSEPQPEGRAVNGRGYTQIRSRDAEPAPRISGGGNGGGWSGSGGGGVSSGGYSNGGASAGSSGGGGSSSGGDSGARVAVPKGGGL
jgi:hypothetical protein